jgi:hypothetical protein
LFDCFFANYLQTGNNQIINDRFNQRHHQPAAELPDCGQQLFQTDFANQYPDMVPGSDCRLHRMAAAGLGTPPKLKENAPVELRDECLLLRRGVADIQIINPLFPSCP